MKIDYINNNFMSIDSLDDDDICLSDLGKIAINFQNEITKAKYCYFEGFRLTNTWMWNNFTSLFTKIDAKDILYVDGKYYMEFILDLKAKDEYRSFIFLDILWKAYEHKKLLIVYSDINASHLSNRLIKGRKHYWQEISKNIKENYLFLGDEVTSSISIQKSEDMTFDNLLKTAV